MNNIDNPMTPYWSYYIKNYIYDTDNTSTEDHEDKIEWRRKKAMRDAIFFGDTVTPEEVLP